MYLTTFKLFVIPTMNSKTTEQGNVFSLLIADNAPI
jgi:hypothetical protein